MGVRGLFNYSDDFFPRILLVVCVFLATANGLRAVPTVSVTYEFQAAGTGAPARQQARLMCSTNEVERYLFWVQLMGGMSMPGPDNDCEWQVTTPPDSVAILRPTSSDELASLWTGMTVTSRLLLRDDASGRELDLANPMLPLGRALSHMIVVSADFTKAELVASDPSVGMRVFSNDVRPLLPRMK